MKPFDYLFPYCTVRLNGIINNQVVSTGTGFFYLFNDNLTDENGKVNEDGSAHLVIVTNKHVIANMDEIVYYFSVSSRGSEKLEQEMVRLKIDHSTVIQHPEANIDLCIILTVQLLSILKQKNKQIHFYPVRKTIRIDEKKLENLSTIQNLLMIGYPNGIWDNVNNLPIMRTGINATPLNSNYLGKECFAVDIATYRGSSGSPVFIYNKTSYIENREIKFGTQFYFIGVIAEAHLKSDRLTDDLSSEEMLHIGIAIKAHKLDVFEGLVLEHYK